MSSDRQSIGRALRSLGYLPLQCQRQSYEKRAPNAPLTFDLQSPSVRFYCPLRDRQSQASPSPCSSSRSVNTVKTLEDPRSMFRRDAGAGIVNLNRDPVVADSDPNSNVAFGRGIADCIVNNRDQCTPSRSLSMSRMERTVRCTSCCAVRLKY